MPAWLADRFEGLENDVTTRRLVAAAVCAEQVIDLIDRGVTQFHFYTMNRADLVYAICHLVGLRPRGQPSSCPRSWRAGHGDEPPLPTPTRILLIDAERARAAPPSARRWRGSNLDYSLVEATHAAAGLAAARATRFRLPSCSMAACPTSPAEFLARLASARGRPQAVIALTDERRRRRPGACCAPARSIRSAATRPILRTLARAILATPRRGAVSSSSCTRRARAGRSEIARARPARTGKRP